MEDGRKYNVFRDMVDNAYGCNPYPVREQPLLHANKDLRDMDFPKELIRILRLADISYRCGDGGGGGVVVTSSLFGRDTARRIYKLLLYLASEATLMSNHTPEEAAIVRLRFRKEVVFLQLNATKTERNNPVLSTVCNLMLLYHEEKLTRTIGQFNENRLSRLGLGYNVEEEYQHIHDRRQSMYPVSDVVQENRRAGGPLAFLRRILGGGGSVSGSPNVSGSMNVGGGQRGGFR